MAAPVPLDDSIAKLEKFCADTGQAAGHLVHSGDRLQTVADALEQIDQDAERTIGETNRELEEGMQVLTQGRDDVASALEELASLAEEAGDNRLPTCSTDVEHAADETEQGAEQVGDDLEESFSRVAEEGFRTHAEALEALQSGLGDSGEIAEQALAAFADGVQGLQRRGEQAGADAASALGEAEAEVEKETTALAGRFDEVTSTWAQSIDGALRTASDQVGASVQQLYVAWGQAAATVASELVQESGAAIDQVTAFVAEESREALEGAVRELLNGPGDELLTATGETAVTLEAGQAVTDAVGGLLGDLRVSIVKVAEIDRILNELG